MSVAVAWIIYNFLDFCNLKMDCIRFKSQKKLYNEIEQEKLNTLLKKNMPLGKALGLLNKKTCLPYPVDNIEKIFSSRQTNSLTNKAS